MLATCLHRDSYLVHSIPRFKASGSDTMPAVTPKIARFRAGSVSAFADLFALFFTRQVRQAERALGRHRSGLCDAEDVALSAFCSLWQEGTAGKFSGRLEDTNGLLGVLQLLTTQKAARARRYDTTQKRDVRRTIPHPAQPDLEALARVPNGETNPLRDLPSVLTARQRMIIQLLVEGWLRGEIAVRLGYVQRTIEREIDAIRFALGDHFLE